MCTVSCKKAGDSPRTDTHQLLKHNKYPPPLRKAIALFGLAERRLVKFVSPEGRMMDTSRRKQVNDTKKTIVNR